MPVVVVGAVSLLLLGNFAMSLRWVAELEAIGDDPERFSAFLSRGVKKRARASSPALPLFLSGLMKPIL
jgi:hypothetical protein